jgi:hypothetical protein
MPRVHKVAAGMRSGRRMGFLSGVKAPRTDRNLEPRWVCLVVGSGMREYGGYSD